MRTEGLCLLHARALEHRLHDLRVRNVHLAPGRRCSGLRPGDEFSSFRGNRSMLAMRWARGVCTQHSPARSAAQERNQMMVQGPHPYVSTKKFRWSMAVPCCPIPGTPIGTSPSSCSFPPKSSMPFLCPACMKSPRDGMSSGSFRRAGSSARAFSGARGTRVWEANPRGAWRRSARAVGRIHRVEEAAARIPARFRYQLFLPKVDIVKSRVGDCRFCGQTLRFRMFGRGWES